MTDPHPTIATLQRYATDAQHVAAALTAAAERFAKGESIDEGLSFAHRMSCSLGYSLLNLTAALYGAEVSQRLMPTTHSMGLHYANRIDYLRDQRASQMGETEATLADIIGAETVAAANKVAESMGSQVLAHLTPAFREGEREGIGALYSLHVLGDLLLGTAEDLIASAGGLPLVKATTAKRSLLDCPKCALDNEVAEAARPLARAIDEERWQDAATLFSEMRDKYPNHPKIFQLGGMVGAAPDTTSPAIEITLADPPGVSFWVDEDSAIRLTDMVWYESDPVYGWTLIQDGDAIDQYRTLDEVRDAWPEVFMTIDDFKAGRPVPIGRVLEALAKAAGVDLAAADKTMREDVQIEEDEGTEWPDDEEEDLDDPDADEVPCEDCSGFGYVDSDEPTAPPCGTCDGTGWVRTVAEPETPGEDESEDPEMDDSPPVCGGCYAVGPEPHAADCIDEQIRQDDEDRRQRGEFYDPTDLGDED